MKGCTGIVRLLLGTGVAKVITEDMYGETAVSWAVLNGDRVMVELLL